MYNRIFIILFLNLGLLLISISVSSQTNEEWDNFITQNLKPTQKNKVLKIYQDAKAKIKDNPNDYDKIVDDRDTHIFMLLNKLQGFQYMQLVNSNNHKHMKLPKVALDDSDGDGVQDQFDLEPNTPPGSPVDTHGVSKDTDGDDVPDYRDKELITLQKYFPVDVDGVGGDDYYLNKSDSIGMHPELGGFVFFITADGKHGKVAEIINQGTGSWYEAQDLVNNPGNHSPDGKKFVDWRIPTKYELNQLYAQKMIIDGLNSKTFWCSTEAGIESAYAQDFSSGKVNGKMKKLNFSIRAIRTF